MNFKLIGKVIYGGCSAEGCKDIREEIEKTSAREAAEEAKRILEEKYPPPYESRKAELALAITVCIFESEPPLYESREISTIYLNIL
ncbi:hypothetical protein A2567_01195 [Candidatus Azambacteria bacterium RIFOXYD1_FULL_42_11]|uniref:Uncharacterized protein n=4 Tax=Candidatus Azamiibacteriota TaxID=1752741 RepID=A0A0G0ZB25_9BACT|nr:MAG: hypothetical protein UV07_C0007G0015 [Candidatus Azambacteria bacterium GW2011_GWB1_42_17]KKS45915.1 MAG: hypothetical protein UV10_C0011G0001 [Candidatus Azambacteria bacterium GW2011_GWA1_42_19]KKS75090.1 MAG: hypothetical protein UV48_C0019G0015 [Candidatus Azambacteria bacterium GW2011_GWA2_42_9]KKS88636.1 MAG: hypothetical protein UV62_C0004G0025 [Parcubacteria group bacterium GW2011_GWC1_43_11]OGD42106.1 MAG: hypothetical protein A2567_01195 [Candidatus Azambacteria bacterium RIFO